MCTFVLLISDLLISKMTEELKINSFDFSVFNMLQKKSLKENGNGWEYTGNNYCDFTHNMGLAVRIFFCNGYFGTLII